MRYMKKTEFIKYITSDLSISWDNFPGDATLAKMFEDESKSKELTPKAVQKMLLDNYWINKSINNLYDTNGKKINKNKATKAAAEGLIAFFKENKIRKSMTEDELYFKFKNENIDSHEPHYTALAEVISASFEKFGKPPLFHKTQDRIIRYDWEKEAT